MMRSLPKIVLTCAGASILLLGVLKNQQMVLAGENEFAPFYVGAQLVGSPYLYKPEPYHAFLRNEFGAVNPALIYVRPPFFAALLWPLGQLPYQTAHWVWLLLRVVAVLAFVALWRLTPRAETLSLTPLCLPIYAALLIGHDTHFLLLWIALSVHWAIQQRFFAAGCILALCAAKFHLFLLVPLWLAGQRRWRMLGGLVTGGLALLGLSFLVAGVRWPQEYAATLLQSQIHPATEVMPNLHGLLAGLPFGAITEVLVGSLIVPCFWLVVRRVSFDCGLAAALLGGLLLSYHAYLPDCVILLPAVLILRTATANRWIRALAILLIVPAPLMVPRPGPYLVQVSLLLLFGWIVWETLRGRDASEGVVQN